MGTKSKHPSPLSEVDSYATAELFSEIARREAWTPTAVSKFLGEICDRLIDEKDAQFADFYSSHKTIKKIIDTAEPINDWNMWAFFLWLKLDYGKDLLSKQLGEQLKRKEQGVKSLREMLGYRNNVKANQVQYLQGSYKIYRPSHVNPHEKILVSQFDIGKEDNHFHCQLSSVFNDSYGNERKDFFIGHVVPLGKKLMAVMYDAPKNYEEPGIRFADREVEGNIVLHFDDVDYSANDEMVQGLTGVVLMAVGNGPASAWPIIARRLEDGKNFAPVELDKADFFELPEPIQDNLNRGAVHWNPRYFPATFSAPKP